MFVFPFTVIYGDFCTRCMCEERLYQDRSWSFLRDRNCANMSALVPSMVAREMASTVQKVINETDSAPECDSWEVFLKATRMMKVNGCMMMSNTCNLRQVAMQHWVEALRKAGFEIPLATEVVTKAFQRAEASLVLEDVWKEEGEEILASVKPTALAVDRGLSGYGTSQKRVILAKTQEDGRQQHSEYWRPENNTQEIQSIMKREAVLLFECLGRFAVDVLYSAQERLTTLGHTDLGPAMTERMAATEADLTIVFNYAKRKAEELYSVIANTMGDVRGTLLEDWSTQTLLERAESLDMQTKRLVTVRSESSAPRPSSTPKNTITRVKVSTSDSTLEIRGTNENPISLQVFHENPKVRTEVDLFHTKSEFSKDDDKLCMRIREQLPTQKRKRSSGIEGECMVCNSSPSNMIFLPCRHVLACTDCGNKITDKCPICRTEIEAKYQIYVV